MNILDLTFKIVDAYKRYLKTTFHFMDPDLRKSFSQALDEWELYRGPYIQGTPAFQLGRTPRQLCETDLSMPVDEGYLTALQGDRPLYRHQEESVLKTHQQKNVVIATGTGSGKTESFLLPILFHLYREHLEGRLSPGVRALILYPMNALANDQRERLGQITQGLKDSNSPFHFTFGQYIGDTPNDKRDASRNAEEKHRHRHPGELVFRSEMRESPPHILLTNYSMLEYLLLRPSDSPLFDGSMAVHWRFLVLDEAHQYRGAKGIEMAMLIRRLKRRLEEAGLKIPLRCIATSATLAEGEDSKPQVARFASELFGEPFETDSIIFGSHVKWPRSSRYSLSFNQYEILLKSLDSQLTLDSLIDLCVQLDVPIQLEWDAVTLAGIILQGDRHACDLKSLLMENPQKIENCLSVFHDLPHDHRQPALHALTELLMRAKDPETQTPLLSLRYHLFLRSLEGAFVSYHPEKRVFLNRKSLSEDGIAFESALCRECGQHYLMAQSPLKEGNQIREPIRDPQLSTFGTVYLRPFETDGDCDTEDIENHEDVPECDTIYHVCVRCGMLSRDTLSCGHTESIKVKAEEAREEADRSDQLKRCSACGYHGSGRDPVREIVHGSDGPHVVIVTALHQQLSTERDKILAFADGRQEAAYFAWYLDRTYQDLVRRHLILRGTRSMQGPSGAEVSLSDLASYLSDEFKEQGVLPVSESQRSRDLEAWLSVYREFLTDEKRLSLEGVGLLRWYVQRPEWVMVPEALLQPPWNFSFEEAQTALFILLDMLRQDRVVELKGTRDLSLTWEKLDIQGGQKSIRLDQNQGQRNTMIWDYPRTRRSDFLTRLLNKQGVGNEEAQDEVRRLLRAIWESILLDDSNSPRTEERLLLPIRDAYRLNPDWWRACALQPDDQVYVCDTCNRIQPVQIRFACPRYRCPGTLHAQTLASLETNHYRELYQQPLKALLRVEEHTAQIDHQRAEEYQRDFRQGKIHVLSCSTTFELGVDLGDLDMVFLRNVPPEAFNYAQRVGRAGRRYGIPGFALVYCRRNPHDLYHFTEPERMIHGQIRPPSLRICNTKIIIRHMTAVALSRFFRIDPSRFLNVETLFVDLRQPRAVKDFYDFIRENRNDLEASLRRIVPTNAHGSAGLNSGLWIDWIAGEWQGEGMSNNLGDGRRFSQAEKEIQSDYLDVCQYEEQCILQKNYKGADWARKRAETIAKEDVLSFLSRKAIIPKYGFPVDVVELDTHRASGSLDSMQVTLQRDMSIALSEYAPTSRLVANKKEWASYALKKVREREWEQKYYLRCHLCNLFIQWNAPASGPSVPVCPHNPVRRTYIKPIFGFQICRTGPTEPRGRRPRLFSTKPYFAGPLSTENGEEEYSLQESFLRIKKAFPGKMVVLNEGRKGNGFFICPSCGAGFLERPKTHKTPFDSPCSGFLTPFNLGHEFVTDILELEFRERSNGDLPSMLGFGYSLAYALVEGAAEVLSIPSTDLNATVTLPAEKTMPTVILYDDVPGGAGLVAELENQDVFREVISAAHERVSGACGCDENTSCYGCLRSYRNQFIHQDLVRGPAKLYLETILAKLR